MSKDSFTSYRGYISCEGCIGYVNEVGCRGYTGCMSCGGYADQIGKDSYAGCRSYVAQAGCRGQDFRGRLWAFSRSKRLQLQFIDYRLQFIEWRFKVHVKEAFLHAYVCFSLQQAPSWKRLGYRLECKPFVPQNTVPAKPNQEVITSSLRLTNTKTNLFCEAQVRWG